MHPAGYQGDKAIDGAFSYEISLAKPAPGAAAGLSCASDNAGAAPTV